MKKYVLLVLIGILVPLFATAGESSIKDISQGRSSKIIQVGIASWYGPGFDGEEMANGKPYNRHALTVAHRTLPKGMVIRVRNLENGESVIVKVTDRGPYISGRIVDLSEAARNKLGITVKQGLARVALEKL